MNPKILFIMHTPPPVHGASVMGQYVRDSQLVRSRFACHCINPSGARSLAELGRFNLRKLLFLFTFHCRLAWKYLTLRPALCYFTPNSWGKPFYRDLITVLLLRLLGARIVIHLHNKPAAAFRYRRFNKMLYRIFFRRLRVIFLAPQLVSDFVEFIHPRRIFVCPNGIPPTLKIPLQRTPYRIPFTFLFLSNMMTQKGVWMLLKACAQVRKSGYSFRCNFVGQWSDITRERFERAVAAAGLSDEVTAFGPKYGDDKAAFLQHADAFVFPSLNEAFGLVLLEAMEYSLPCIGTDEGGIPGIVSHGVSGFIIPKRSGELAGRMMEMMEHPAAAIEMGRRGRELFEKNFTLERFETHLVEILDAIIHNRYPWPAEQ